MRLSVSMEIDQLYPALLKKAGTLLKIRSSFPTQLNATVNYIENPLVLSSEIYVFNTVVGYLTSYTESHLNQTITMIGISFGLE
ncbi:hypothetical protein [Bacillus smithii]|uniref:hypothetical protein n=1 Tax=Bacillus smithii TaxID=1479 RepID=UPI0030C9229B